MNENYGDNLMYESRWDTLVIRGTGKVWPERSAQWEQMARYIRIVKIEPGCTELGNGMFFEWKHLESVTFPDTLQVIGSGCFEGCGSLQHMWLPAGVTLGDGCFSGCVSLESVQFRADTRFGNRCFQGCRKLSDLFFEDEPDRVLLETVFADCPVVWRTADDVPNFSDDHFEVIGTDYDEDYCSFGNFYVPKDYFYELNGGPVKYAQEEQSFYLGRGGSLKILNRFGRKGTWYLCT